MGLIPGLERFPGVGNGNPLQYSSASPVAQLVKNLPTVRETWVQSLGWEDSLEKGTATHSSILIWRIPRTTAMGSQESSGLSDFHSHPVTGGGEKASKVKGSIATWGCQRVGRKGGQRWRKRQKFMGDLRSSRRLD